MAEHEELTDADWRTLCDTLRGLDAMFDMLLVECADSSETARVVEAARRRRESVLEKDRGALRRPSLSRHWGHPLGPVRPAPRSLKPSPGPLEIFADGLAIEIRRDDRVLYDSPLEEAGFELSVPERKAFPRALDRFRRPSLRAPWEWDVKRRLRGVEFPVALFDAADALVPGNGGADMIWC
jgi:hypothetical protein